MSYVNAIHSLSSAWRRRTAEEKCLDPISKISQKMNIETEDLPKVVEQNYHLKRRVEELENLLAEENK